MHRRVALAILLVAGAAGAEPALRGVVLREGKALDVATAPLSPAAVRCREPDQKALSLRLELPASASPHGVVDTVLALSATPGLVTVGEKREPQTAGRSYDPQRDRWGRVLAWISAKDRGAEATLPSGGWVRWLEG